VEPGYPKFINSTWDGLPDNIDAAFTWPSNRATYFFKGKKYLFKESILNWTVLQNQTEF
jgi:hypothetical protein